jgi:hypothetical protein
LFLFNPSLATAVTRLCRCFRRHPARDILRLRQAIFGHACRLFWGAKIQDWHGCVFLAQTNPGCSTIT